ncbi:methylmalonyl-CoA mutase family protein [Actinophytocola sp.]|uniref:methylmalonyl-CoA mutase family protein n=1 Tax=Actinophytocola sp. TaxID=1872138 RepID=UPI003D6A8AD8
MDEAHEPAFRGPADVSHDYERDIGDPGEYPFTRGHSGAARTGDGWVHRELSGEGSPAESNRQLKYLISQGATGLDVIGDAPTVGLMDPDHPYARESVGTQGVSICRVGDFSTLYDGIPLEAVSVSHSLPACFTVAGLYQVARDRGMDPALLRGSTINAPFFMEDYAYATLLPFDARLRMALDAIEFATEHMPRFHPFVEDTYFISDGGIGPVEEMALGFIEIREVVRRLIERGLDVDRFARRIAILVNCRMTVFAEIAKIRASRRIFARMMREEFGATDPRSWQAHITVHTSGASLTAQQPVNNVVRGAVQAFALALAGVKAMEISAFDEAYRTPSDAAHLVALRTQQVVALESDALSSIDPLGGSYFVESLTDSMEARILERVRHIEGLGSASELFEKGYFRSLFQEAMIETNAEVADGVRPVVGVNTLAIPEEEDTLLAEHTAAKITPSYDHTAEVARWKAGRDPEVVRAAVDDIRRAAADPGVNLVGPILSAFASDATIGEITGAIRVAYGMAPDPLQKEDLHA